jgi:mannitol-1-phosphate/altronate dehydrogenase
MESARRKLTARREMAKGAAASAQTPRIEHSGSDAGLGQFNPKHRERLRRVTSGLTDEIRSIALNPVQKISQRVAADYISHRSIQHRRFADNGSESACAAGLKSPGAGGACL